MRAKRQALCESAIPRRPSALELQCNEWSQGLAHRSKIGELQSSMIQTQLNIELGDSEVPPLERKEDLHRTWGHDSAGAKVLGYDPSYKILCCRLAFHSRSLGRLVRGTHSGLGTSKVSSRQSYPSADT